MALETVTDANLVQWLGIGLVAAAGFILQSLIKKLDQLNDTVYTGLSGLTKTMNAIERDMRGNMAGLDRRVTRLETRCDNYHGTCPAHEEEKNEVAQNTN